MVEFLVTILICLLVLGLLCVVFYIKTRRSAEPSNHHLHTCGQDHCTCEKQSPKS